MFTTISSDSTGCLHRRPFSLTSYGRIHRNCLVRRIRPGFSSRFNNFLISACVCIVLQADEKTTMSSRTVVPEVSR